MKFGRRGRSRGREPIWTRRGPGKPGEDSIIELPSTAGSLAPAVDLTDDLETATDDVLRYLAAFSRECADPSKPLWSDACMNQLILCMEVAVEQGWSEVATVLEDTGRILQTYEAADCAEKSANFLKSAYNILCTMIGDIVVEKSLDDIMEVWDALLASGLEELANNGLRLYIDTDDDDPSAPEITSDAMAAAEEAEEADVPAAQDEVDQSKSAHAAAIERMIQEVEETVPLQSRRDESFDVVQDETTDSEEEDTPEQALPGNTISLAARAKSLDELPTLDALPPLESLVDFDKIASPKKNSEAVDLPEADDEVSEEVRQRVEQPAENPDERSFALFEMPRSLPMTSPEPEEETETIDEIEIIEEEFASADEEVADSEDDSNEESDLPDEAEDVADEEEIEIFDPPRIVVDIIDRICDVLSQLEPLEDQDLSDQLAIMTGGLEALGHEAKVMGSIAAMSACQAMMQACGTARTRNAASDAFIETGFAFCGIFIEALGEGASENVTAWQAECEAWLKADQESDSQNVEVQKSAEISEEIAEEAALTEAAAEDSTHEPQKSAPKLTLLEAPEAEGSNDAADEPIENAAPQPKPAPDKVDHAAESQALLLAAQQAAASGRGEDAKTFALRAAAEIAKAEVQRAEFELREAEIKLKESVDLTSEARKGVKSCETNVRDAATRVEESRSTHAERQQEVGRVAEKLESLESGVAELNRQIQELQAKRDEEVAKVAETVNELDSARQGEVQSHAEWEELKKLENDTRHRLEEARQNVKEKQRVVQGIESEMERAREQLTQQRVSLSDISQAIQQISGSNAGDVAMQEEGMLF